MHIDHSHIRHGQAHRTPTSYQHYQQNPAQFNDAAFKQSQSYDMISKEFDSDDINTRPSYLESEDEEITHAPTQIHEVDIPSTLKESSGNVRASPQDDCSITRGDVDWFLKLIGFVN